ncbi:ferric reductase NAD binding domain-containing protein [Hysterangium stoloniferum]|nr:ferric reductase NAD binding domain-containing protein [Hysterangium stoloniferum]
MSTQKPVDPNKILRVYRDHTYPREVWYSLSGFVGLLTVVYLIRRLILWRAKRVVPVMTLDSKERGGEPSRSPSNASISSRHIPLSVANTLRIVLYRFTLPIGGGSSLTVAEIVTISGYIIMLFTWEFVNCTNITTREKLDPQYWANRAANMAAIQLPLLPLLSGKNNLMSLLTGISYEKLNVLHRAAARTCFVLILVHASGRAKLGFKGDTSISEPKVKVGIPVAVAYGIVFLLGLRPFRTRHHEIFFSAHLVLVLFIVVGVYNHIRLAEGYSEYIIPVFILWGLDRTFRLARILWNNRSIARSSSDGKPPLTATAELLSPSVVRVSMKRDMSWKAGQNVFLTMPAVSAMPHEAHPFTICNIPGNTSLVGAVDDARLEGNEYRLKPAGKGPSDLVFFIKVKNGFTKRLSENVKQQRDADGRALFSVLIDGPYGTPPDVNAYESVILIAGGSGITFSVPLLQDIVLNTKNGRSACREILFIWIVPHEEEFSWISGAIHEALQTAPSNLQIRIHLHATQSSTVPEFVSGTGTIIDEDYERKQSPTDSSKVGQLSEERIRTFNGRPNIRSMLEEEIRLHAIGTVSVNVAGPPSMAEDVRKALRFDAAGPLAILRGRPSVNLHVETFVISHEAGYHANDVSSRIV